MARVNLALSASRDSAI